MPSSCLGRAAVPVKRVWRGLIGARLGHRRRRRTTTAGGNTRLSLSTYVPVVDHEVHDPEDDERDDGVVVGLGRLRKEVRTCEYRDVHVMWEMLSSSGGGAGGGWGGSGGRMVEDDDDVAAAGNAGKGVSPETARRGRKSPAPWSRVVAYCCGAF